MNEKINFGKKVKLEKFKLEYINEIYNWESKINQKYLFSDDLKIRTKSDQYEVIENNYKNNTFLIFKLNTNKPIGFLKVNSFNKEDGFMFINSFCVENVKNAEEYKEAIQIFSQYLFLKFPIRKIYFELFSFNKSLEKIIKSIGFKEEAKFDNFRIFMNGSYTKYILALYNNNLKI